MSHVSRFCFVSVLCAGVLTGCGGGGSQSWSSQVLETSVGQVQSASGGSVVGRQGSEVQFPARSLSEDTRVTLEVRSLPKTPASARRLKYAGTYARVVLDEGTAEQPFFVRMPAQTAAPGYHRLAVSIAEDGTYVPCKERAVNGETVELTVDPAAATQTADSSRAGVGSGGRAVRFGQVTVGHIEVPAATVSTGTLLPYDGGAIRWTPEKRVAVCVHGILSNRDKFTDTGFVRYLRDKGYDEVWSFDYNYTYSVRDSGAQLAQLLSEHIKDSGTKVDIYAHSMGGLVSRWAIEQSGAANYVDELFTFGTPHEGTVLAKINLIWLLGLNDPDSSLSWMGEFADSPAQLDLTPSSDTLDVLNSGAYRVSTRYTSIGGWVAPLGLRSNDDWLVLLTSSNSTTLADRSIRWVPYEVKSGHSGYFSNNEVKSLLESSNGVPSVRAELTWDTNGTDVDLHLVRPGGEPFTDPDDCYYANKTPDWGQLGNGFDDPSLDFDDVDGFGAEHIVLKPLEGRLDPGEYKFYINYYRGSPVTHATLRLWVNDDYVDVRTVELNYSGGSSGETLLVATLPSSNLRNVTWSADNWRSRGGVAPPKNGG